MNKLKLLTATTVSAFSCLLSSGAQARVTSFDIIDDQSPSFEGREFGEAGQYRRIKAIASFAVDPKAPANSDIVDLELAGKNDKGEVEFSTEVVILQPATASKGNGELFFEIANRGRNLSLALINDSPYSPDPVTAADGGNGYLFNEGYTIAWSGWQTGLGDDVVDATYPIAEGVEGLSREEFIFDDTEALSKGGLTYPVADEDLSKATLTVRINETDERQAVEGLSFRYLGPQEIEITRPAELPAGAIYEFIYPAKESVISGLGFAVTRDLVSFLRGSPGHDVTPPTPAISTTLGLGISQSGRFARDFLYQGFNADENGKQVFDGLMAHIAGSRKTFTNYRFAQPGRYSRQHEDHAYPGDQFPFSYATTEDVLTGKVDGILEKCTASNTCPKVIHSDTDTEFWQARASLVATDTAGNPIEIPENVRLFYLAGAQHFTIAGAEPSKDKQCLFDNNLFHVGAVMRSLVASLNAWVTDGVEPPDSRFPNQVGVTLVKPADLKINVIPGLEYDGRINTLRVADHSAMPPSFGDEYPIFVAAVDTRGNVIEGVELPRFAAALGTHAGWNLRTGEFAKGELCSLSGSYIPFAATVADKAPGDKRPSIEELYTDQTGYLASAEASINDLKGQGLILEQDVSMLRQRAAEYWESRMQ